MRICFLGESFVNGTGDRACLGWTGRICQIACQQGFDLTYYNLGIRGETSTELVKRWLPEVQRRLSENCDGRVVFSFGVNDTTIAQSRRVELSNSLENVHRILSVARPLFPVLMIGPPPIAESQQNLRIAELSGQMATVSESLEVPYLEVFSHLKDSQVWASEVSKNDGAHPREAGYAEFAAIVQSWSAWAAWFH